MPRLSLVLMPLVALMASCQTVTVPIQFFDPCNPDDTTYLPEGDWDDLPVADLLTPFDVDDEDQAGPAGATYGKSPEIVAIADGLGIDVLAQNYGAGNNGVWMRLEYNKGDYQVVRAVEVPMLDRIMGLARDDEGNVFVASGIIETELTNTYPAPGEYREGIVRVVKLAPTGEVLFDVDLDIARETTGEAPELLINPMVAATSRLAWGDGIVALVHGINTDFDGSVRHQKAITTHLDATSGAVTRTSSVWVSHSFDQRLLYDGQGFLEMHLGDAYPRTVVLARVGPDSGAYPLLHIKGNTGDNNTYTRLGNMAPIEDDPDFGYLGLFITETTEQTGGGINGARNLGLVRVLRDFQDADGATGAHLDPNLPDTQTVIVAGVEQTNSLRWLTTYSDDSGNHAERAKLIDAGCGEYIVLWEQWDGSGAFDGTYGMLIDAARETLVPETLVTEHHLPRGDDAFALDNTAAWISGSRFSRKLHVNKVFKDLSFQRFVLD